jgi:hypothetical protein
MHRIDQDGHVGNRFSPGNPQAGQLATRWGVDWPNAVQEEICKVVEAAGIPLDKAQNDQLYEAIVAIAAGAAGSGGGSVPTTRNVNGAGLVTGGGPLAADLTLSVGIASFAEVLAGLINNKALTPLSVAGAFGRSLTTSGYSVIPFSGGFMFQWITGAIGANTSGIYSLPTTFPNACLGAFVNSGKVDAGVEENDPFCNGYGTSNISVFSASNVGLNFNAFAFGY